MVMKSLITSLKIWLLVVGLFSSQSILAKVVAFECVSKTVFVEGDYTPSEEEMAMVQKLLEDSEIRTHYHLVDLSERVWETRDRVLKNVEVSPSQISVFDADGFYPYGEYLMINRTDLKFATKGLADWGNLEQRGTCKITESPRAF